MKTLTFTFLFVLISTYVTAQSWKIYDTVNSAIPTNSIMSVYAENDNKVWLCTYNKGLVFFDGIDFVEHNANSGEGIDLEQANYVVKDASGNYWITSEYKGVYKYSADESWTHYTPEDMGFDLGPYQTLILRKLAIQHGGPGMPGGALWIASYNNGIIKYDGENWTNYNYQNGLPTDGIESIAVEDSPNDTNAVVWAGTAGSGLIKFNGTGWDKFPIDGDTTQVVNAISFDNGGISYGNGTMYVGTFGQFCIYKNNTWTIYAVSDAWNPNNEVKDISVDPNHNVWFAMTDEGLGFYDETQLIYYYAENSGIPANNVFSVDVSNNDDSLHVWLTANYTGLTRFTTEFVNGINYNFSDALKLNLKISPNPVKENAVIKFTVPYKNKTGVHASLFDLKGQKIAGLINENKPSGDYVINLNTNTLNLTPGEYIVQLKVGNIAVSKKIIVQ